MANARLIAAAPELLTALQDIQACVETSYATPDAMNDLLWQIASVAIVKATQTTPPKVMSDNEAIAIQG